MDNFFSCPLMVGFAGFVSRAFLHPLIFLDAIVPPAPMQKATAHGDARFRASPLLVTINSATRCRPKAADFIRPNQPCQTRQGKLPGTSPCILLGERDDGI
jgi:hypothetical protein